jgi:hypothetical protein
LADESSAGDVYAEVIETLLDQERTRKTSLEQKALSVITSSGVLVTLLFGFASLTKSSQATGLPVLARAFLIAAMAAFLVAILGSLRINQPVNYSPLGVKKDLQRMVTDELWFDAAAVGRRAIAEFRVGEIDRWREQNGVKARQLQRAIVAESAGVALLAVSVGVLLFRSYPG